MIMRPNTANRHHGLAVPVEEVELYLALGWALADDEQKYGSGQATHLLLVRAQQEEKAA